MLIIVLGLVSVFIGYIAEKRYSAQISTQAVRNRQFSKMTPSQQRQYHILKNIIFVLIPFQILALISILLNSINQNWVGNASMQTIDVASNVSLIVIIIIFLAINIIVPKRSE